MQKELKYTYTTYFRGKAMDEVYDRQYSVCYFCKKKHSESPEMTLGMGWHVSHVMRIELPYCIIPGPACVLLFFDICHKLDETAFTDEGRKIQDEIIQQIQKENFGE